MDQTLSPLEFIVAAIAHSPIVVRYCAPRLPAGFEAIDMAVLEWLAAEARRLGRGRRTIVGRPLC